MDFNTELKKIAEKRQQLQTSLQQAEQVLKNCQAELFYLQGKEDLVKELQKDNQTVEEVING
tara:strand:+ start:332 stop:517 length:186 start_codon:yes stop_codon:yes gene_type:complete